MQPYDYAFSSPLAASAYLSCNIHSAIVARSHYCTVSRCLPCKMSLGQSSRFSDHVSALSSQRTRPVIAGTSIHHPALSLGHGAVVRWMERFYNSAFTTYQAGENLFIRPTTSQLCIGAVVGSSCCQTKSFFLEDDGGRKSPIAQNSPPAFCVQDGAR